MKRITPRSRIAPIDPSHVHKGWHGFVVYRWSIADWYQVPSWERHTEKVDAEAAKARLEAAAPGEIFKVFECCQIGPAGDLYAYRCDLNL